MLRSSLIFCLVAFWIRTNVAQYVYCQGGSYNVVTDVQYLGCDGYPRNGGYNTNWVIQASRIERQLLFGSWKLGTSPSLVLKQGSTVLWSYNYRSTPPTTTLNSNTSYTLTFVDQNLDSSPGLGFQANLWPSHITPLVSAQPINITPATQDGSMLFFALNTEAAGARVKFTVRVYGYQGLLNPSLYVQNGSPPTVAVYQYTNTTLPQKPNAQTYIGYVNVVAPANGAYYLSVYYPGTIASMQVRADWTYNYPYLLSNQKMQINASTPFQMFIPPNTPSLTVQLAQITNGQAITAYLYEGTIYGPGNEWFLNTTNAAPYTKFVLDDPNPTNNSAPNPGVYLISISCQTEFVIQVNY